MEDRLVVVCARKKHASLLVQKMLHFTHSLSKITMFR